MNKGRKFPAEVLTCDEVHQLMRATSRRAPTGVRNKAIIALTYFSGLRVSEMLALKPKDIDLEAGKVDVLRGKGSKRRIVALHASSHDAISRWLDVRKEFANGHHNLFCTLKGDPVSPNYVRQMMPRMAKRAGITKRTNPHSLRHSHAYALAMKKVPIHAIQGQLGHANAGTTSIYLNHLAPAERLEMINAVEY